MLTRRGGLFLCFLAIAAVTLHSEGRGPRPGAPRAERASVIPMNPVESDLDAGGPALQGFERGPDSTPAAGSASELDPSRRAGFTCTTLSSGVIPRGGSYTLTCPAGSVMTGGGAETLVGHESGTRGVVEESYPVANGWRCESRADPQGSFTCYVRCCTAGPIEASR